MKILDLAQGSPERLALALEEAIKQRDFWIRDAESWDYTGWTNYDEKLLEAEKRIVAILKGGAP